MATNFLKNITLVVTRPKQQGLPLCEKISNVGGTAFSIPTIEIQATEPSPSYTTLAKKITKDDIVLFVSANAVIHSKTLWLSLLPEQQPNFIAIGPGTTLALKELNLPVLATPTNFNSEGLLALPQLQNIKDKTIYLVSGKNPRPLLAETLKKRQARLISITCYQRALPSLSKQQKQLLNTHSIHFVITTSLSTLENWCSLLHTSNLEHLLTIPTLIVDKKHLSTARKLGFTTLLVSPAATDNAILETLKQALEKH